MVFRTSSTYSENEYILHKIYIALERKTLLFAREIIEVKEFYNAENCILAQNLKFDHIANDIILKSVITVVPKIELLKIFSSKSIRIDGN